MPLENMVIIRVSENFNHMLQNIALESGVSKSALVRNTLALCLMPPNKPNQMDEILLKIRKEATDVLYGRGENNGEKQIEDAESIKKAESLKKLMKEP